MRTASTLQTLEARSAATGNGMRADMELPLHMLSGLLVPLGDVNCVAAAAMWLIAVRAVQMVACRRGFCILHWQASMLQLHRDPTA